MNWISSTWKYQHVLFLFTETVILNNPLKASETLFPFDVLKDTAVTLYESRLNIAERTTLWFKSGSWTVWRMCLFSTSVGAENHLINVVNMLENAFL